MCGIKKCLFKIFKTSPNTGFTADFVCLNASHFAKPGNVNRNVIVKAHRMNKPEELVSKLCTKSFLSLWSYRNPRGKDFTKELCDILVVCEPDIIIFSVKEINITDNGDVSVNWSRWHKRAIEESCKQIYGAERWISNSPHVITREGKVGLPFPDVSCRRIHRVAVALGSKGKVPIQFGDFSKGFVHVFDKLSLDIVMNELDTISDFVKYLVDKELLCSGRIRILFNGGEEDLLAFYLHNERNFPRNYDLIVIDDNLWAEFTKERECQMKKKADKVSYIWDRLIGTFCNDFHKGNLEFGNSLTDVEKVTRVMAREDRFCRRILGKEFIEFIELASQQKVRSRKMSSPSGILYVFLACPHGKDRKYRVAELCARCFVIKGLNPDHTTVIGIATEQYEIGKGFSLDALYLYKDTWTSEDQTQLECLQKEFGYFVNPIQSQMHEDEYPNS